MGSGKNGCGCSNGTFHDSLRPITRGWSGTPDQQKPDPEAVDTRQKTLAMGNNNTLENIRVRISECEISVL